MYVVHTNLEVCPSFPHWDIKLKMFSQFDPCWFQNDLWPPPRPLIVLNGLHPTYHIIWYVQASNLEILYIKCFHNLTPCDHKWTLIATKKWASCTKVVGLLKHTNMTSVQTSLLETGLLGLITQTYPHTSSDYKSYNYHRNQKSYSVSLVSRLELELWSTYKTFAKITQEICHLPMACKQVFIFSFLVKRFS